MATAQKSGSVGDKNIRIVIPQTWKMDRLQEDRKDSFLAWN